MLASSVLKCPISRVVDRACDPSFFLLALDLDQQATLYQKNRANILIYNIES